MRRGIVKDLLTTVCFSHYSDKFKRNAHLAPGRGALALRGALNSIEGNLGCVVEGGILYHDDGFPCDVPNTVERQHRMLYADEVKKVAMDYGMTFVMPGKRGGYRAAYLDAMSQVSTPFVFHMEHDWQFVEEFSRLAHVLYLFQENPGINYAKFCGPHEATERFRPDSAKICPHFSQDVWRAGYDLLMPDSLWSTNPNISRMSAVHEWMEEIRFKNIGPELCALNGRACGIEEVLTNQYLSDIVELGFAEAHRLWGVYLILKDGKNLPIVQHVGV